jgi:hypothetical protein
LAYDPEPMEPGARQLSNYKNPEDDEHGNLVYRKAN